MLKIDKIDMMILSELSNDASVSIPKISKKIHVNSSVIYSRIKSLTRKKIIKKFTVAIDDHKLGYDVKSLIGVNMNSKIHKNVTAALLQIDGVRKISEVTGRFDVLITAYAKTLAEMHDVISEKIGKVEGVLSSESFIEMSVRENPVPYGKV